MFEIFADTHKIIASEVYDDIYKIYDFKLNKDKLLWGSIAPDILPKYKLIRHYQDESLNYIALEIMKIIFISRYIDFRKIKDPIAVNILSRSIGVISHYLSDYVCLPHAKRWTFADSMIKHVRYESKLNDYAANHSFRKNIITVDDLNINDESLLNLRVAIKNYIMDVVDEYMLKTSMKNDLDFALSLNLKITYFILDVINEYSEDIHRAFALEF
ncbi:MAG: zinc dependent phospholipase C family protein [Gudongella sp.]|nr:zinc dependent phospholipase C family protein [Gudongella sp.]